MKIYLIITVKNGDTCTYFFKNKSVFEFAEEVFSNKGYDVTTEEFSAVSITGVSFYTKKDLLDYEDFEGYEE